MLGKKIRALFTSRRFLAAIAGIATVISQSPSYPLSQAQVMEIVAIVAAWILGDAWRETK